MKKLLLVLVALMSGSAAFADGAPDCSKFNLQIGYNAMDPIRDIIAGKIVATTRMYSDRCEKAGQTLDVVLTTDPVDGSGKRHPQARILITKVTPNLAFAALTDAQAKQQGQANATALRAALTTIYGKDKNGNPVDLNKQTFTHIEFKLAR
jgi:hypothetical protein